jgi:hypothetical protein
MGVKKTFYDLVELGRCIKMQGEGAAWQNAQTNVRDTTPESFWLGPSVGFVGIALVNQRLLSDVR